MSTPPRKVPEIDRSRMPKVAPVDADIVRVENRPRLKPTDQAPVVTKQPAQTIPVGFKQQLQAFISQVAIKKYGDNITANDLLEALEEAP